MKRLIFFALLLAAPGFAARAQQANSTPADTYYCPPCMNGECDTIAYHHAGNCPFCHMALVKKAVGKAAISRTANAFAGHWEGYARTTDQQLKFSLTISTEPAVAVLFTAAELNAMAVPGQRVSLSGNNIHFELVGDDATTQLTGSLKDGKITGTFVTDDPSAASGNRQGVFELKSTKASPVNYTVREVTFRNGNVVIAGSLYLPDGPGKFPAVVCNHSSGDKSRYDGAFMADFMARRGIAVLIYDKRGNGRSTGDWKTSTFEDLADDCIAGVKLLKSIPGIDPGLIGIFGHSQGATISPIMVNRCRDIAFNVAAAGFAVSPVEQDVYRVTNILKHRAHFNEKVTDSALSFYKLWLEVARTGKGWEEMKKANSKVKNRTWYTWVEPPPDNSWPWKWYLSAGNYNYVSLWEKVTIPTLLIYGKNDEVTPVKPSVANIETALKKAGNRQYQIIIMPNAIHYFAQVKKEGDLWAKSTPGYFEHIYNWINGVCRAKQGKRQHMN